MDYSKKLEEAKRFKMQFGKYKGETLEDIHLIDPQYLEFVLNSMTIKKDLEDAICTVITRGKINGLRQ